MQLNLFIMQALFIDSEIRPAEIFNVEINCLILLLTVTHLLLVFSKFKLNEMFQHLDIIL